MVPHLCSGRFDLEVESGTLRMMDINEPSTLYTMALPTVWYLENLNPYR